MSDSGWLVLMIGGPLVLGVLAYWKWKYESARREQLAALALQGKWDFSAGHDTGIGRLCDFEIFNRGEKRYAYNTITGKVEYGAYHCELDVGDFSYTTQSTDGRGNRNSTKHHFSYLVVRLPFRDNPEVRIRREGLLDRVVEAVGFEDINFESDQFSRAFHVTSTDKRFAYDLIHPRVMQFMLEIDPPALIEVAHGRLCLTDGVRRWNLEEFRTRLHWAREFVMLWPEHLARELPDRTI